MPKEPGVVISVNTLAGFSARAPNLTAYVASKTAIARVLELAAFETPESVARFMSVGNHVTILQLVSDQL